MRLERRLYCALPPFKRVRGKSLGRPKEAQAQLVAVLWCFAYCLMANLYHLLIELPEANLVQGMRRSGNGEYGPN